MSTQVTYSAVIPTFDRPDFLREAVESVRRQTHAPVEVIVVNSGSQGLSWEIEGAPEVRVLQNEWKSSGAANRNLGAKAARGGYIAFLDDDDLWASDYLERLAEVVKRDEPDMIVARLDRLRDGQVDRFKALEEPDDLLEKLLVGNPGLGGTNIVVKRESFLEMGGFDEGLTAGQDRALGLEYLIRGYRVVTCPRAAAIMRDHGNPRVRTQPPLSMLWARYVFFRRFGGHMKSALRLKYWCLAFRQVLALAWNRSRRKVAHVLGRGD